MTSSAPSISTAPVESGSHPATDALAATLSSNEMVDALIQPHVDAAIAALGAPSSLMSLMARYHLGQIEADGRAKSADVVRTSQGKRLRPAVALLSCAAAGGDRARSAPVAAAIELLHQFTLIHDDIQDESPTRRHRPTVWTVWGIGQAINAGDAMHASAHLALYRLIDVGVDVGLVMRLAGEYDRMTIEIVRGQVRDLGFEGRDDVTPDDYLDMISGKTSAIIRYAAMAGALIAGVDDGTADAFARFGLSLGIGFQIQDDMLGIWGAAEQTGKAAADDIRRRKQSLPILLLRSAADGAERRLLDDLYHGDQIDETGIDRVLALLDDYDIRTMIEARVQTYHDEARTCLLAAAMDGPNPARDALLRIVEQLAIRDH